MIKRFAIRVGLFFSLPFVALFGFLLFNVSYIMNVKNMRDRGYLATLNELMNFIYDAWVDMMKEVK